MSGLSYSPHSRPSSFLHVLLPSFLTYKFTSTLPNPNQSFPAFSCFAWCLSALFSLFPWCSSLLTSPLIQALTCYHLLITVKCFDCSPESYTSDFVTIFQKYKFTAAHCSLGFLWFCLTPSPSPWITGSLLRTLTEADCQKCFSSDLHTKVPPDVPR